MKERIQVKVFALQALAQCSGEPMPEAALISSVSIAFPHLGLNEGAIREMIRSCESGRLISSTRDPLTEQNLYVLTARGAAQLAARG